MLETLRSGGRRKPGLHELMKDASGVVDSGVPDLGSNPKHLKGFGRCPPRSLMPARWSRIWTGPNAITAGPWSRCAHWTCSSPRGADAAIVNQAVRRSDEDARQN
ncbi:MAG: hypothetical protein HYY78_06020 [Betaproteobacteria bacterium]|nr:hypothetical protein [Betaproteobacteria bacterium]